MRHDIQKEREMTKITEIEGIGDVYAQKLEQAGVQSVESLLTTGGTPAGRKALAEKAGISDALILRWVNHADLFRIKGVAGQYAELLEAAGVDTVVELSHRNAENLTKKMVEVNEAKKLVRSVPSEAQVKAWIEEAKALPRSVSY
jgi:predicted flap endonuclease-1-like 5' DNA nuclease